MFYLNGFRERQCHFDHLAHYLKFHLVRRRFTTLATSLRFCLSSFPLVDAADACSFNQQNNSSVLWFSQSPKRDFHGYLTAVLKNFTTSNHRFSIYVLNNHLIKRSKKRNDFSDIIWDWLNISIQNDAQNILSRDVLILFAAYFFKIVKNEWIYSTDCWELYYSSLVILWRRQQQPISVN